MKGKHKHDRPTLRSRTPNPVEHPSKKQNGVKRKFERSKEETVPAQLLSALEDAEFDKFEDDPQFDEFLAKRYCTTKEAIEEFRTEFFFKLAADVYAEQVEETETPGGDRSERCLCHGTQF